jgi:trans-aconitate 2-methyltransferase
MVARAQQTAPHLDFAVGDLRDWRPEEPVDVLVSNATLQWVPDHLEVLTRLAGQVAEGGWLALQVPGNFDQPSHTLRDELATDPRYAPYLADVATPDAHDPETYLERLAPLGRRVDVWETTYLHVLEGEDPVFDWVSATGARPTLQALPDGLREPFADELRAALRSAYPRTEHGTVLPFRRVFAVLQK